MPRMYVQNVAIPVNTVKANNEGVLTAQTTYSFPTNVITASASIASYTLSFGSDDHHIKLLGASVSVQAQNNSPTVTLTGTLQIKDGSNNGPDAASCTLMASVVAWAE
jgi:hypothetical protein